MFRKIIAALTLSLAFVYSASAATFNVNTTNDTVDANTGNNVCADANGKCSLRAAVMQANNTAGSDKINLPAGTYKLSLVGANEDLSATGDLDVNETLTVVGVDPNTTIIDGVLSDRIFDVHPMIGTPAFKLQNVHLTKGTYASGSGGAILHQSTGQVTLLNSKFSKNSASSIGVLYTLGPVTIQDSIFEDNTASSNVGVLYKTGAGDLLIDSSRFESNKTSGGIAVIYNVGGSDLTKITDSEFINNQASSTGGVLYQATNGPLAISGTTISGNISSGFTGIYCSNPATSLTIEDSEFLNNLSISGGIITCQFSTVARIKNSTFSDNTTFSGSGTIALQGSGVSSDLIIEDSNFVSNAMISGVGGVLAANLSGSMRISRSDLSGNSSSSGGGALFVSTNENLLINDSTFNDNTSGNGPGGAVYANYSGFATISNSSFGANSSSSGGGGALYLSGSGAMTINESAFFSNTATSGVGGALYVFPSSASTIRNTTISGNHAEFQGGGIYGGGQFTLTNVTFAENTISQVTTGSALYLGSPANLRNTVIADPTGTGLCGPAPGVFTSLGNNIVEDNTCNAILGSDDIGNPILASLADNGGDTMTHALGASSPALDKFTGNACPSIDQRGEARPFDGDGDGTAKCDSGAFESHDRCPNDPKKLSPGVCGCGTPDTDSNNNGIKDCLSEQDLSAQALALRGLVAKVQSTDGGKKFKAKKAAINKALTELIDFSTANASGISVTGVKPLDKLVGASRRLVKKALKNKLEDFVSNKKKAKKALKRLAGALA